MSDEPQREAFARVQPLVTEFAISLQEEHGLKLDQVANALMSAGIALAVGVSGKVATVAALGGLAQAVASGRYDDAATIESGSVN